MLQWLAIALAQVKAGNNLESLLNEIRQVYSNIGTHWVALYVGAAGSKDVIYFDFFGVEHIPKEIKAFIGPSLSVTTNISRIEAYDSIMCGYFCTGFIDFILAGKTLTKFTNLFSPNNF